MRRQVLAADPAADGIARDAQVFGDLLEGNPRLNLDALRQQEIERHKVVLNAEKLEFIR